MNIAYFGSPTISSRLLQLLLEDNATSKDIKYIFTQPDRPAGKKLDLTSTPVKDLAKTMNLPIFDKRIKGNEKEVTDIMTTEKIDLGIVFAYGEIIPSDILSLPSKGYFNVHPSNLPIYRGPSPLAYTCILGDAETAVSIMALSEKMDDGPVIIKERLLLETDITRPELEDKIPAIAYRLLGKSLQMLQDNTISYTHQEHDRATYTKMIQKEDGYIQLDLLKKAIKNEYLSNEELPHIVKQYINLYGPSDYHHKQTAGKIIYNIYRGLYDWPGIWTKVTTDQGEKRLKIIKCSYSDCLLIQEVQLEGKKTTDFQTFNRAYSIF